MHQSSLPLEAVVFQPMAQICWRWADENKLVWINFTDDLNILIYEGNKEITIKIHLSPINLCEVVWPQQDRITLLIDIPDAILLPDWFCSWPP